MSIGMEATCYYSYISNKLLFLSWGAIPRWICEGVLQNEKGEEKMEIKQNSEKKTWHC